MNKSKSLPWDEVEQAINKEIKWLEDTITDSPFKREKEVCSKCIFRKVEPNLSFGRADLGVYKKGKRNLFVEVGTVSVSKLLFNLELMKGSDILLVLDSNHAVEFSILDVSYSLSLSLG